MKVSNLFIEVNIIFYKNILINNLQESVLKLKITVSDFMDKVNNAFKESTTVMSSKHKKVDQSDNNDLMTDNVDTEMVEVVEPNLALSRSRIKTIQDPEEIKLIVTSRNTNSECDCEVIAKPEEAGGIVLISK